LLGARGPKALERVVRTYDGWVPIAGRPHSFKRDVDALRKVATDRGRDLGTLNISAFVAPMEDGISLEDLKLYQEAGADRLVLFSQGDAIKMAAGETLEIVRRLASTVERAEKVG
jgi:alkanesulfonate monooxygenase SsuD/methylene tetrahydromethanopterin reductase-like flavin-dependent oxidoreductase (luciferase family)